MIRTLVTRGLLSAALILTLVGSMSLTVSAAQGPRDQEARETAKQHREDNKATACERKEAAMKRKMQNLAKRGENQIAVFDKIAERTRTFYGEKGRTIANYDELSKAVDTAKANAETAVATTVSSGENFTCNAQDPKASVTTFKENLKAQHDALKAYKTAVKNLMVGVKSAQGQASRSQTSDDDATKPAAETETTKPETEGNN